MERGNSELTIGTNKQVSLTLTAELRQVACLLNFLRYVREARRPSSPGLSR